MLSSRQIANSYGSLSLFTSIIHNVFLLYHVETFVSIYKIDKTSFYVGESIFLIWNSVNDPIFGWLSDNGYLQKSSFTDHPSKVVLHRVNALSRCGPLFCLSFLFLWFSWIHPSIQFTLCLCLYDGFLTIMDLHHNALLADLSISAEFRTYLNKYTSIYSGLGATSVFLSYLFWSKENFISFQIYCICLTMFAVVGLLVATGSLKRHYKQVALSKGSKDTCLKSDEPCIDSSQTKELLKYAKQVKKHSNFWWFAGINLIQVFHCHFNSNFFPLFLDRLLGDAISPATASILLAVSFVAPHLNNVYFLTLCRQFGTYRIVQALFFLKLLLAIFMFALGPSHWWMLALFIASNRIFTEGTCKLLNLIITDLIDEDFVIHHRKQAVSALVFGMCALLSKPGQTFAPCVGTFLFAAFAGHDIFETGSIHSSFTGSTDRNDVQDNAEKLQSEGVGCFQLLVYVPIVCAVLQLLLWSQFSLHGKRLRTVKSIRENCDFLSSSIV